VKSIISIFLSFFCYCGTSFSQEIKVISQCKEVNSSFRGLSVVNDSVAWVSGSNGWIGKTLNGGTNWKFFKIDGFENLDFRTLYGFNANKALVANAGSPAYIFITENGGENWDLVYQNLSADAFIDGVDFWNENIGIIHGDPIEGRMLILKTFDGGKIWDLHSKNNSPALLKEEASFAASGTVIRTTNDQKLIIATGGKVSRLWISENRGESWNTFETPILQGKNSTGIFSFEFKDSLIGIIVGGDYTLDTLCSQHVFITADGGKTWNPPKIPTRGYRSCVAYISEKIIIATGTSGTDVSYDGGIRWNAFDPDEGFNAVRKARDGKLIIMAGSNGRITSMKIE
jgi:photosystem II stability/assembly factor-like uncharacterized protein